MRRLFAILLAPLLMAQADIETDLDTLPQEWVERRSARYGFDLTLDGNVWININRHDAPDAYALLATDLLRERGDWRRVWMRGYHARNPDVSHRESKTLISVNCPQRQYAYVQWVHYDGDGRVVHEGIGSTLGMINAVPGSIGERWTEEICAN